MKLFIIVTLLCILDLAAPVLMIHYLKPTPLPASYNNFNITAELAKRTKNPCLGATPAVRKYPDHYLDECGQLLHPHIEKR